jgi:hypothetical protein
MTSTTRKTRSSPRSFGALACAGACLSVLWAAAAAAQGQPVSAEPDMFAAIGRWVDDTLVGVTSGFNNARGTLDDIGDRATDTAKGAAETAAKVARIPLAPMVSGRQRCVPAANGAPDCVAATEVLCRTKGFSGGRSVDVQSAQKCPAEVWISGRQPAPGECTLETYVTRAVCQ